MYIPVLVMFRFPILTSYTCMSKLIQLVVADNHIPLFSLFSAIGFLVISKKERVVMTNFGHLMQLHSILL